MTERLICGPIAFLLIFDEGAHFSHDCPLHVIELLRYILRNLIEQSIIEFELLITTLVLLVLGEGFVSKPVSFDILT